jgi:Holin of 3TMs, for gene-transfer release
MADETVEKMSASEKKKEDWMNSKWRPMMGWMYMGVCSFDFVLAPIFWSLLQSLSHGSVQTQWQPLTLQGAGLFHIAMGAVLGIAAHGRTQEKLNGANNGGLSQPGLGTTYTPPPPTSGGANNGFNSNTTSGFGSTTPPASTGFGGGGFGSVPSTAVNPTPSWGTTLISSAPAVNASGKKVVPTFDQPAI